jgi:hypothetical protein
MTSPFPLARHGFYKSVLKLTGLLDGIAAEQAIAIEGNKVVLTRGADEADVLAEGLRCEARPLRIKPLAIAIARGVGSALVICGRTEPW